MVPQLPEPDRHPSPAPSGWPTVARAAVSPSAAIVTAAGFVIGLAAQGLTLAIVLAVVAWLGRMVVAIARARRPLRRLPLVAIDPYAVSEPWRQYVRQALAARQRFDQAVTKWPAGPLQDRLVLLQPRLGRATEEVWSLAQQGAALDGVVRGVPTGAIRPSIEELSAQLRQVQAERQQASASDRQAALDRSEEAIAAQLRAANQSDAARAAVLDRLRLLTARLDEAVTQLLALGLERPQEGSAEEVAASVDALLDEIGALQQGLKEVEAAASGAEARGPEEIRPGPAGSLPPPAPPASGLPSAPPAPS
jgi:hypothetical protein